MDPMHLWWKLSQSGAVAGLAALLACACAAAAESPDGAAIKPRRLVLCLDGTSNNDFNRQRREQGQEVLKPTNVLKLARGVMPWDQASGREQIAYYDTGVGATTRYPGLANRLAATTDRLLGGAFGAGFEANVERGLTFLALNYQPGDEVFLFGFSRGAATARGLTRFLDWAGGIPRKTDAYYLPVLFQKFVLSRGQARIEDVVKEINDQSAADGKSGLGPLQPVDVRFLGVWDTVMALGSRFRSTGGSTSEVSKSFYTDQQPARCVRHARQALAVDEARFDFRPEIWSGARDNQSLEQRWFAGVHSNIGGGYLNDGLANLAFLWILHEAEQQGLAVDPAFVGFYRGFVLDRLYRSESLLYRILDGLRWRYGRGKRELIGRPAAANLSLDASVVKRLRADPKEVKKDGSLAHPRLVLYRPQNVIAYLACQPDLDQYLAGIGLKAEQRQLPKDVLDTMAVLRQDCAK
ncbi:MAG: DUF2235 domain-containing protein [Acidobacteriota bacterium]|nr:DUF2235 domain-containing protein [Acidobacteriota bacterium]